MEKGLSSTRAATKQHALEALLLYIEIDKADAVVEEMLPALSHKQPKIIAATLAALTQIYHQYGVKIVDPKPVLKALPKVFGHADKNVRAEASNVVVELYRWLKDAIKTLFWSDLKPVQQQDLEKLFENVKQEAPPKQQRLLRSQQVAVPTAAGAGGDHDYDEGGVEEEAAEMDAYDFAEPVDVLAKAPKDLQENLASSKWKERKEALDAFYAVAKVDRIKDGSYDEIISSLAKCMKDANIAVVTVAANCVEALANGLRKPFAKYRSRIMAPMFERLKEKKQSVADALGAALDAVFTTTGLSDCLVETLEFLKHKNPQVKLETLRFLIRCLKTTRTAPSKEETKSIADAATKLLTESTEITRSGGAEILGTLMKIMGERQMNPYLDGLDDIRKTKIKEYFDAAEVKAKDKPAKPVAPKAAPAAAMKKKVAPGTKKPPGAGLQQVKKAPPPAPRAPTPEEAPTPAPKSVSRLGLGSKLSGPGKPGLAPVGGLKFQKKLGGAAPLASPKRNISPQTLDEEPPPPAAPRVGLGRGLAGRPLSKPQASEPVVPTLASTGMSSAERAELDELRALKFQRVDIDELQKQLESIRLEKTRLDLEVNELRNHEAELIEERTRNRLTIKAKETQLVRARGDAEEANEIVQKQQREIERLKRELTRSVRPASPPAVFPDIGGTVAGIDRYESDRASREIGYQRARVYMTSPSEEKENNGDNLNASTSSGKVGDSTADGPGSPKFNREGRPESRRKDEAPRSTFDPPTSEEGGVQNWRRAAEVTSALKQRIEQMKVRGFPF